MPTTEDYLKDLIKQKQNLINTLTDFNVEATSDETFNTLFPKVKDIYNNGVLTGQKSEYDRFWDDFQGINGSRRGYTHAFAGQAWSDNTYNPKYPITLTSAGSNMFAWNIRITSTKVPLILDSTNTSGLFSYASALKEVPSIKVTERVSYTNWFTDCKNLETINFTDDSIIANNINISPCAKLTKDSLLNIISVLKDFRTTQSYDCSFKNWQEEYMADFMESFPSFAYGKFFECDYEEGVMYIFIPEADASVGIPFDENIQLPSELETAVECAFDESGESITLKFATTTATRTLTLGATNLGKLTDLEKAEATQKGWTLA